MAGPDQRAPAPRSGPCLRMFAADPRRQCQTCTAHSGGIRPMPLELDLHRCGSMITIAQRSPARNSNLSSTLTGAGVEGAREQRLDCKRPENRFPASLLPRPAPSFQCSVGFRVTPSAPTGEVQCCRLAIRRKRFRSMKGCRRRWMRITRPGRAPAHRSAPAERRQDRARRGCSHVRAPRSGRL